MGLEEELETAFGSTDLYALFCVERDAPQEELKKAFRRQALQFHPDKARDDPKATNKFQLISRAYAFLSSPSRRKAYDRTGVIDDEDLPSDPDFSWEDYWHEHFPPVQTEDIDAFARTYKESKEEEKDLKTAYKQHKGDLKRMFSVIPLSNPLTDLDRFRAKIEEWIAAGEVPDYDAFRNEQQTKQLLKEAKSEASQAEKSAKKAKHEKKGKHRPRETRSRRGHQADTGVDLASAILKRQEQRRRQFADLEERYTRGKTLKNEPTEEEFARIQAELEANKTKRAKQGKKSKGRK